MSKRDYSALEVLVVDDQSFIRLMIKQLLQQIGFKTIREAEDGAAGIELHNKHSHDLIICDIEMEPIDGLVFLQTVRKAEDSGNNKVPIIFLTQHASSDIVKKAQALKVNAFIVKPPSVEKLRNRIEFVLG